jgi:nucleoside 2-deoxyribosyltransferase
MKIFLSHPTSVDFKKELYEVLQNSFLASQHEFIFPHQEGTDVAFHSKELFQSRSCDLVIADVSVPRIGVGIEMGWAEMSGIPVMCIYKKGSDVSGSAKLVTKKFIEYADSNDLINKLSIELRSNYA